MLKLSNIGERLFNSIDNFFQGPVKVSLVGNVVNLDASNILDYSYIEWDLNQSYIDIVISDLKASFGWIIPGSIRKVVRRIHQSGLIYLYTDTEEEGITETNDYSLFLKEPGINKVLSYPQAIQDAKYFKCLYISDWLKYIYRKCAPLINYGLLKKPYYLLGNFAPSQFEVPITEPCFIMKEFNGLKLKPAFAYHKRI
jgi:hypothetical protein